MKKYKKKNNIDLKSRANIKIITANDKIVSDNEIELFRKQLNARSQITEDFCKYYIEKQLENQTELSQEELNNILRNLKKQHKILKSILQEEKDTN